MDGPDDPSEPDDPDKNDDLDRLNDPNDLDETDYPDEPYDLEGSDDSDRLDDPDGPSKLSGSRAGRRTRPNNLICPNRRARLDRRAWWFGRTRLGRLACPECRACLGRRARQFGRVRLGRRTHPDHWVRPVRCARPDRVFHFTCFLFHTTNNPNGTQRKIVKPIILHFSLSHSATS